MGHHQAKQYIHYGSSRGRRQRRLESLLKEIMLENFPDLAKETVTQILEAQRIPNKLSSKKSTSRYIIIMFLKVKKVWKQQKQAPVTYKGTIIRL